MNRTLRDSTDWEAYAIPLRYQASGNDRWGWSCDGNPKYQPRYPQHHDSPAVDGGWTARYERYWQKLQRK